MKKLLPLAFSVFFFSCASLKIISHVGMEKVDPKFFKTQIPFVLDNDAIYIRSTIGADTTSRILQLDNHAPTCLLSEAITGNHSITKLGTFFIDKQSIDGGKIKNIIYSADTLRTGNIIFTKVMLNEIPYYFEDVPDVKFHDGLLGTNLFAKAVWKIDFENKMLTVSSSIDSMDDLQGAKKIPAEFTASNIIRVQVNFVNNVSAKFDVDLGFDASMAMMKNDFDELVGLENTRQKLAGGFMAVTGVHETNYYILKKQQINIGDDTYTSDIISNDLLGGNLLGVSFFSRFKYVIFDYINKQVYVSKEMRATATQ